MVETIKQSAGSCSPYDDPSTLTNEEVRGKISCLNTEIENLDTEKTGYANDIAPLKLKEVKGTISSGEQKILNELIRLFNGVDKLLTKLLNYRDRCERVFDNRTASILGNGDKKAVMASLLKETNSSESFLKAPKDWTETELKDAMKEREQAQHQDKQDMMMREREWFDHYYGTEPVKFDETGKMIQPKPVRAIPSEALSVRAKDGLGINEAVEKIIALLPQKDDESQLIKGIQSGLNILTSKQNQSPLPNTPKTVKLKEDGVVGPKTSFGLKKALVNNGSSKVSEALALGQFKETVKKAKKEGPKNLADELGASFDPLLGDKTAETNPTSPVGLAVQDTLNDFGANLKDDGIVGPKTQGAFSQIVKSKDEDELVNQFGYNLGFEF